jgi:hypothetical protein
LADSFFLGSDRFVDDGRSWKLTFSVTELKLVSLLASHLGHVWVLSVREIKKVFTIETTWCAELDFITLIAT